MNSKIKSYVGFAVKCGKVLYGVDNIENYKKTPYIILTSPLLSENSRAKLNKKIEDKEITVIEVDLEAILPGRNCKALGILEKNLAKAIKEAVKEN